MTLLSIIQDSANETGTVEAPLTVIGNTEPSIIQYLRLANKVGKRLMKAFDWQVLRGEQTFTSVATETQTSILPSGFDRIVKETFWNRSTPVMISGPISPTEWQGLKARSYSTTNLLKFAYRGGAILVVPTLSAGDTLAFEYVSQNWCQSSGGTGQTEWAADTDTGVLDEELMTLGVSYAFLESEGLPSNVAAQEFDEYYQMLVKNENPSSGILNAGDIFGSGRHFGGTPGADYTGIYSGVY